MKGDEKVSGGNEVKKWGGGGGGGNKYLSPSSVKLQVKHNHVHIVPQTATPYLQMSQFKLNKN
jgi:hypothetical protein